MQKVPCKMVDAKLTETSLQMVFEDIW